MPLLDSIETGKFNHAILLVQLSQHLPVAFKHHRADIICNVINCIFTAKYEVSAIKELLAEADALPSITKELCGKPPERILWEVSQQKLSSLYLSVILYRQLCNLENQ